jgi:hypothetical protein
MTEEDKELELLKAKRLREMQKNISATKTRGTKGAETFYIKRSFSKRNSHKTTRLSWSRNSSKRRKPISK